MKKKVIKRCSFLILILSIIFVKCSSNGSNENDKINQSLVAYTNLDLIDGISASIKTGQTVLIDVKKGEIIDIFETGSKTNDDDTEEKNMEGKVMMPGLIEGHFHLASTVGDDSSLGKISMENMFKQGITSVRDMAGNGIALTELKTLGSEKNNPYPKIYFSCLVTGIDFISGDDRTTDTAGSGTAGEEAWFITLDDNTDVVQLVQDAKSFGCTALKLYADISSENAKRIIIAAKSLDFPVWSHGTLYKASPWDIEGVHSFSHSDFFNYVTDASIPTYLESNSDGFVEDFNLNKINSSEMQSYFDLLKRNNTILDATLSAYSDDQSGEQDITKFTHEVTKSAHLRGVEIGAGSDNFNESVTSNNFLLLNEIKLIKEITGMSEMNALKTATINNAKSIGIDDEYGTIEIGKKADLIILNDNPLENLDNLKSIELVIKDGFEHNL